MILFIKVVNGVTVDHPVLSSNLLQFYGDVPADYEMFDRTEKPPLKRFEVDDVDAVQYARNDNGIWTDVWPVRVMTPEERAVVETAVIGQLTQAREFLISSAEEALERGLDIEIAAETEQYIAALKSLELSAEEDFMFPIAPFSRRRAPSNNLTGTAPSVIG